MSKNNQITDSLIYLLDTWYDLCGSEFEFE